MKLKLLSSLILFVVGLSAQSQTVSDSVLCTIHQDVAEAQVHVRTEGKQWSLLWDYIDGNNYRMATIKQLSSGNEDIYKYSSLVTISHISDGKCIGSTASEIAHASRTASLKLCITDNTVLLLAGDGTRCIADKSLLHFDGKTGSRIIFRRDKPIKHTSVHTAMQYRKDKEYTSFYSLDQLDEYLSASTDSIEGYWTYLDRDIDAPNTILGGYYTLATVRNGDSYDIIYVSGADKYSYLWEPLQVKGHLYRTIFTDNFDLVWTNSQRTQTLDRDVYVTFEQNALMTAHFPLYKSEVRFSRKPR